MTLNIAPDLTLPDDAVTETFAILAKRGVGKSNTAVVMAEEMYDAGLPWVAIDPKGDWWGVRSSGDGKQPGLSVLVFGGEHADVPLEATGGNLVADLVVDHRLTCVLDVSEMTKADQRRFLIDFATRLYKRNREPLHVFCEEADEYVPQRVMGDETKLVRAFEILVKRGRFKGLGCTLITQRSASLNNDVLTQVETLIAMRTTGPPDRKAIKAWVDYHESGAEAVAELAQLANGEAWLFSPHALDMIRKVQFRRRRTFDSGATPKVGQRAVAPTRLADVDLAAIKEAMADTIERAQADDPKALRKRIADLERALAAAEQARPEPVIETVPAVGDEMRDQLLDAMLKIVEGCGEVRALSGPLLKALAPPAAPLPSVAEQQRAFDETPAGRQSKVPIVRVPEPRPKQAGDLRAGARRMVESLGRMAPLRLTKGQWGMVAKLKTTGGTWSTYLGEIKRLGLVEEDAAGYTLTDAGFDYIGGRPAPMTAAELQDHYRTILRAGAVKMLDALMDAHPARLTKDEIGDAAGIVTTGGTFSTYLGELIRNGLAERTSDGRIRATDILMHGANQ